MNSPVFHYKMSTGDVGEYAYTYGVVCGKYSKLFDYRVMENFIEARGISEILASLESTEYEKDIHGDFRKETTTGPLEHALKKHFMRIYEELARSIPKKDMKLLDTIILEELNVRNLKIILRAMHTNMPQDRLIQMIGPSREDDNKFIKQLSESKTIEEFVEGLRDTPYQEALSGKVAAYNESGNLLPLEAALDKVLVEKWNTYKGKDEEIENFLGAKIDVINIKNVIKCRIYDIPLQEHIFEGGLYLNKMILGPMAGVDVEEMGDVIKHTIYGGVVKESIEEYKKTGSLMHLEVGLEKTVMTILERASRFNPLGISLIISFINLKWKEVKNLITIAICKSYDIPPKEIKELMI